MPNSRLIEPSMLFNEFAQHSLLSQGYLSLYLSARWRKLLAIGIALIISLIALPVEAEGLLAANKPPAEKTASDSLSIQERQEAV